MYLLFCCCVGAVLLPLVLCCCCYCCRVVAVLLVMLFCTCCCCRVLHSRSIFLERSAALIDIFSCYRISRSWEFHFLSEHETSQIWGEACFFPFQDAFYFMLFYFSQHCHKVAKKCVYVVKPNTTYGFYVVLLVGTFVFISQIQFRRSL